MMKHLLYAFAGAVCLFSSGADWPQFRGSQNGVADARPPLKFTPESGVAWKVDLPGKGVSSPIVVQDRVIVTCSGGANQERIQVLCFAAKDGEPQWTRTFWATGRTFCHPSSGNAAPTPASDGERIYAFYSSNDLICLDLQGNLLWYRGLAHDYPKAGNDVGMASSPVVINGVVVVQIENEGDSFAAGVDAKNGKTLWRKNRDRAANWSSPTLLPAGSAEEAQVLLQSGSGVTACDPRSGTELWKHAAGCASITSPSAVPGHVFLPSNGVLALDIRSGSAAPEVEWTANQLRPGNTCLIVHEGRLYAINNAGVLAAASAEDGKLLWQLRLGGSHWANPVLAGNHIYAINEEGKMRVVELNGDKKPEIVGESDFGEKIMASPAVSGGRLFVRSDQHLWCIGEGS